MLSDPCGKRFSTYTGNPSYDCRFCPGEIKAIQPLLFGLVILVAVIWCGFHRWPFRDYTDPFSRWFAVVHPPYRPDKNYVTVQICHCYHGAYFVYMRNDSLNTVHEYVRTRWVTFVGRHLAHAWYQVKCIFLLLTTQRCVELAARFNHFKGHKNSVVDSIYYEVIDSSLSSCPFRFLFSFLTTPQSVRCVCRNTPVNPLCLSQHRSQSAVL